MDVSDASPLENLPDMSECDGQGQRVRDPELAHVSPAMTA